MSTESVFGFFRCKRGEGFGGSVEDMSSDGVLGRSGVEVPA